MQVHNHTRTQTLGRAHRAQPRAALRAGLRQSLRDLERASRRLRNMEAELGSFLEEYYARVGPLFETLEQLRCELENGLLPAPPQSAHAAQAHAEETHAQEIKSTFRRLARACHPDVQRQSPADDTMRRLNHAYAINSYGALVHIECENMRSENEAQMSPAELRRRHRHIQATLRKIRAHTRKLQQSPAYQLLDKVIDERLSGRDLIAYIAGDAQRQIERSKRQIVIRNIREIARLTANCSA